MVVDGVPTPVVLGGAVLLGTLVWLVAMWVAARALYWVWRRVRQRVRWVLGLVFPESPLVQFAAGLMLFIGLAIATIGVFPSLVGDLGQSSGPAGVADDLSERGLSSDWDDIVDGDTIAGTSACRGQQVDGPDRDEDGLPDAWERAGETPDGAELPDADPGRKDLYIQVNHGSNVDPLSETERQQLRDVWARMPVANPDGSTGIDIHVVDTGPRAGSLGERVVFSNQELFPEYYTEKHLGERLCVYHQVTYGKINMEDIAGLGAMPGYATIVDGRQPSEYPANVSFRVDVTTHELLHNVVGRVAGRAHTSQGWLAPGLVAERLSGPTARELNETGLFGPVH